VHLTGRYRDYARHELVRAGARGCDRTGEAPSTSKPSLPAAPERRFDLRAVPQSLPRRQATRADVGDARGDAEDERQKLRVRIEAAKRSVDTGVITLKITELTRDYVTQPVLEHFVDECDALRVKKVALNNQLSSKGKVRNRPGLKVAREHRPDIIVIGQTRKGKGNALAYGFDWATGDFIVMLDADGSSDPAEILRFVDALRQAGNYWLNRIVNVLYGTRYTDLCHGYNAFRRDCLDVIHLDPGTPDDVEAGTMLWGDGFEVETLINVRVAKARVRVFEVSRFERNRVFGTSNLNAFSDGLRVLRTIHTERTRAPGGPQPRTRPRSDRRNPGTTRRRAHDGVTRCL